MDELDARKDELLRFGENESLSMMQIINWMYTGRLYVHNETLYPIMKLSKKLQIQSLVNKCKKLDEDNVELASLPQMKGFRGLIFTWTVIFLSFKIQLLKSQKRNNIQMSRPSTNPRKRPK